MSDGSRPWLSAYTSNRLLVIMASYSKLGLLVPISVTRLGFLFLLITHYSLLFTGCHV
jgi:hypothetical protein